jgi:hypothetical protein
MMAVLIFGVLPGVIPPKGIFPRGLSPEARLSSQKLYDIIGFEVVISFEGGQSLWELALQVVHVKIVVGAMPAPPLGRLQLEHWVHRRG